MFDFVKDFISSGLGIICISCLTVGAIYYIPIAIRACREASAQREFFQSLEIDEE